MIRRLLPTLSFLSLTLGASLLAAPFLLTPQARPGVGNPAVPQAGPLPRAATVAVPEPAGRALCLAISQDGKILAAGCTDRSVYLLDAGTGERQIALAGAQRGYIRGVAFMPSGKTIAAVSDDNQLLLWDMASGKLLTALPALGDMKQAGLPQLSPNSLAISPDGGLIAVGGGGTTDRAATRLDESAFFEIRVLDAKTGGLVWSHLGRRGYMDQLAFSTDAKTLASTTHVDVRLWDARTGDLKQTLKPRSGTVEALAFSPDNRLLAGYGTAYVDERGAHWLTVWDLRSGAIVHSIDAGEASGVSASGTLAFSHDGKSLASSGVGTAVGPVSILGRVAFGQKVINHIKLWDVATGAMVWTSAEGDLGQVTSLVFSPDGKSLFCCDLSATSRIDARTGQTRQDLMRPTEGRPK